MLKLSKSDYFVVSIHREENVDNQTNFINLLDSLNKIAENFKKRLIVSTHPRTKKKLSSIDHIYFPLNVGLRFSIKACMPSF